MPDTLLIEKRRKGRKYYLLYLYTFARKECSHLRSLNSKMLKPAFRGTPKYRLLSYLSETVLTAFLQLRVIQPKSKIT